jgi:hypothetical protein
MFTAVHIPCKVLGVQSCAGLVEVRCSDMVIFPEDYKNTIILFLIKFIIIYLEQCRQQLFSSALHEIYKISHVVQIRNTLVP